MILFSPRFDAKCNRWKEWLQGRVLEARAVLDGARIVIAAIYQHVWSAAKTLQANKDDRAQVLSALAKVVRQVPKRDSFVIAGDFNTSLRPHPALIGQRALTPAEVRPDEHNLTKLLAKLRLVALNTWQCAQAHTYEQGATATQIDYILTKEGHGGTALSAAGRLAVTSLSLLKFLSSDTGCSKLGEDQGRSTM